jgi:hypothetical protein
MNITVVIYALMTVVLLLILGFAFMLALNLKPLRLAQSGDSSLGPRSVNWLAAIAIGAAVWICLA